MSWRAFLEDLTKVSFPVPSVVSDVAELALLRVQAIFSDVTFYMDGEVIWFESSDPEIFPSIRKELAHALYRQKIYKETKHVREALYSA